MKKLICLIFVSVIITGSERRAIRALYHDEHQWVSSPNAGPMCGICRDSEGRLKSLSCHKEHRFHVQCINEWKEQSNTCPMCRREIVDSACCNCLKVIAKPSVATGLLFMCGCCMQIAIPYIECNIKSTQYVNATLPICPLEPTPMPISIYCNSAIAAGLCALGCGAITYHCCHSKDE